eukprot:scaffold35042_cov70-Phaeocystis_antarctica.AAC.1
MRVIDVTAKFNKMILANGVRAPTGRVEYTKHTDGVEPTKKNKLHTLAHAFKSELGDGVASFELVLEHEGKRISLSDEHPDSLANIGKRLGLTLKHPFCVPGAPRLVARGHARTAVTQERPGTEL